MDYRFLSLFAALFTFRYLRTIVSVFTFLLYKPKPIKEKPTFRGEDVTVIIPTTFKAPGELVRCLRSILACAPAQVFIVTAAANVALVKDLCTLNLFQEVCVLGVDRLNKRHQMLRALKEVQTSLTVCADDDVSWPEMFLDYLLAVFEDPTVGAGGSRQRVRRHSRPNAWNFLGIAYLERRAWNNISTNAIDGSISTLSGRTAAYRTDILKTDEFFHYFTHDTWLGRPLNSDDDKCLTRYVYSHGWNIALQSDRRAVIETTMEDNSQYIAQCIRWARAHWRGNLTVMTNETYWRSSRFWWGCYVIYAGQMQTPAALIDGISFWCFVSAFAGSQQFVLPACACLGLWVLLTKTIKLLPHFLRYPEDFVFLPVSLFFSYLHGLIIVYALFTLHRTHWGSQQLESLEAARAENEERSPLLGGSVAEADHCSDYSGSIRGMS